MKFELLPAAYDDLDPLDPMHPAVIVHVLGKGAHRCYEAVSRQLSTYVVGRGFLPPEIGDGYFFTAGRPDYQTLRSAILPHWTNMPLRPPTGHHDSVLRAISSQELADVFNYTSRPPHPDLRIFDEAQKRMPKAVAPTLREVFAQVCIWLCTHMLPADNCYTLAALLSHWLQTQDVKAEFSTGQLAFTTAERVKVIPHAWVEVDGDILDLTVDQQHAWGKDSSRENIIRIGVRDPHLTYSRETSRDAQVVLERYWRVYSKPESRFGYSYTTPSLMRQATLIKEQLQMLEGPPSLRRERAAWTALVVQYGIMEGTSRLLEMLTQNQVIEVEGAEQYEIKDYR